MPSMRSKNANASPTLLQLQQHLIKHCNKLYLHNKGERDYNSASINNNKVIRVQCADEVGALIDKMLEY